MTMLKLLEERLVLEGVDGPYGLATNGRSYALQGQPQRQIEIPYPWNHETYQPNIEKLRELGFMSLFNLTLNPVRLLEPIEHKQGFLHCQFQLEGGMDPEIVIPLFDVDGYIKEAYACLTENLALWSPNFRPKVQQDWGSVCLNIVKLLAQEFSYMMRPDHFSWFCEKMMMVLANPRKWYQPGLGVRQPLSLTHTVHLKNIVPREKFNF